MHGKNTPEAAKFNNNDTRSELMQAEFKLERHMIITALLTFLVLWCILYGILPHSIVFCLCVITSGFFAVMCRHKHEGFLTIDIIAQNSRLNKANPALKFWMVLMLMLLSVFSNSYFVGLSLAVIMLVLIVFAGGMGLHDYLSILALPLSFLLLSGLALLIEYSPQPAGVINLQVFQGYFIVSRPAQLRAALVLSRAFGAISCLYLLSLSTTMSEIIGVLRRFHTPDIIIELMYLIYRYTFILLDMHRSMKDAAASRLGFINFSTVVHTTGRIYSNLLARSYRQANINFDAMESRCYTGEIRFLESHKKVTFIQAAAAVCLILFTLGITIALY